LVPRETLARFHELKKFTDDHISRFESDIKPFFPHCMRLRYTRSPSKFAAVALSRVPIPEGFGSKSLTDEERAKQWREKGFQIVSISELDTVKNSFTEGEATSFLALLATGLAVPT